MIDMKDVGERMTRRELATVLAALRFWMEKGMYMKENRPLDYELIATDMGEVVALDYQEIDNLAQRLNYD